MGNRKIIVFRKRTYERKMTEKLEEAGKTGQWFSIYVRYKKEIEHLATNKLLYIHAEYFWPPAPG